MNRSKRTRGAELAAIVLLLAGCTSTPDALLGSDGKPIRGALPPAYVIAVAPVEVAPGLGEPPLAPSKWELSTRDSDGLRARLISALEQQRAGSRIVSTDEDPRSARMRDSADLVIVPRLREASFAYRGASDRVWVSAVAWFFTWIGSLWVTDAEYQAHMVMDCEIIDTCQQRPVGPALAFESGNVALPFWSRNSPASVGFLMTMVFPPFWARDEARIVSASLTDSAMNQVAARFKRYLTEVHPQEVGDEVWADVRFSPPANETTGAARIDIACAIRTRTPVDLAEVFVDEASLPPEQYDLTPSGATGEGAEGLLAYDLAIRDLELEPGENVLRLWLRFENGRFTTRTVVVERR